MQALAAIALGAAVLGGSLLDTPDPVPLTDVQREMIESGMFEPGSFREPAFEALVENVRSWARDAWSTDAVVLDIIQHNRFDEIISDDPGAIVIAWGEVMMIDPIGDAFQGVTRLTLRTGDRNTPLALLVFTVDQQTPEIGDQVRVIGRAYKVMHITTQHSETPMPFPAVVGRYEHANLPAKAQDSMTGAAIITALTGALAVVFFVVVIGRHMLGKGRPVPVRRPLASSADPTDDAADA